MYRLWLIFAQAATVAVAALFVVSTFRPEWLPSRAGLGTVARRAAGADRRAAARGGARRLVHDAVQRATPSVVNIFTSKEIRSPRHPLLNDPIFRRFFGEQLPDEAQRASSLGSGVIVSASGYVLTNHHVVEAADEIEVALPDGKKLLAKVVGNDPETDLAVLRVNAENLPAITFGSSDALRVGDVVLAIGNPFGVGQTVTGGIVSRARPHRPGHQHLRELHPDRRRDQPGQLRRRADRRRRQPGRHQHRDLLALRRLDGHRLRHPGVDREDGARADRQDRQRDARLDRRRGAGDHAALAESFKLGGRAAR